MGARLIGPLSGTIFVVLVAIGLLIGGNTPAADDSAASVVAFYVDTGADQQLAGGLLALGCLALVFFLGTVHRSLRNAADGDGTLATTVALGGLMIAVGLSVFAGLEFTLGDAADDLPASATLALNALNNDLFFPFSLGTAAFSLALGLAVLRNGGLPRPLGWLALVVGIGCATPVGYFASLSTGIVIVWLSIVLTMRAMSSSDAPS
jgi:hypothetical protein